MTSQTAQPCPTCLEERELRAFLAEHAERLPVGLLVEARRLDLYAEVMSFRRAGKAELAAASDAVLRAIDALIVEASRSSTVERMTLAREAERQGLDGIAQADADAVAWRSVAEGVCS